MSHPELDPERAANLAENPYAGQGPVLLDIGDDVGAIVLHLGAALEGAEVEIEPAHADEHHNPDSPDHPDNHHHHRLHVAVVGRPVTGGLAYAAVFPELLAGRYALILPGHEGRLVVDVRGGEVNEVRWPRS